MIEQKAQRLLAACAEGNLDLVNRIASKFETPEEMCETDPTSGYSPLMMAARHGHLEIAEVLIRLGHDRAEISRVSTSLAYVTPFLCWGGPWILLRPLSLSLSFSLSLSGVAVEV